MPRTRKALDAVTLQDVEGLRDKAIEDEQVAFKQTIPQGSIAQSHATIAIVRNTSSGRSS